MINTDTVIIFMPVPNRKPTREPQAVFKAGFHCPLLSISSPKSAPRNGPIMIPKGPMKRPITSPIVEPIVDFLLPPNFFVMATGNMLSVIDTIMANIAVITNVTIVIWQ